MIGLFLVLTPLLLQAIAMLVDEFYFHTRRPMPVWERWGHPLDTITFLVVLIWVQFADWSMKNLVVAAGLSLFSVFFVTKDEWVHRKHCSAGEMWLHSILFVLHPIVLIDVMLIWAKSQNWVEIQFVEISGLVWILPALSVSVLLMFLRQIFRWNFFDRKSA